MLAFGRRLAASFFLGVGRERRSATLVHKNKIKSKTKSKSKSRSKSKNQSKRKTESLTLLLLIRSLNLTALGPAGGQFLAPPP